MYTPVNSKTLGADPARWPIVTNVYRWEAVTGYNVIYTVYRHEEYSGQFKLTGIESDQYCYYCATSVHGTYGIIMHTRHGNITHPMYMCIGCVDHKHSRPGIYPLLLSWSSDTVNAMISRMDDTLDTFDTLTEIHTCIRLRGFGVQGDDDYERLQRMLYLAKKL